MGIENDQLLAIQNDLHERLKARDEARERAVSNKLHKLEQKHEFANTRFLKHFAQVSELLESTVEMLCPLIEYTMQRLHCLQKSLGC